MEDEFGEVGGVRRARDVFCLRSTVEERDGDIAFAEAEHPVGSIASRQPSFLVEPWLVTVTNFGNERISLCILDRNS